MNKEIAVTYKDVRGEEIRLTGSMVKEYISTDPSVTTKEVVMFLQLAKFLHLNPFLKEIYLVKYKGAPAQYIISYHALLERAEQNQNYDGFEVKVEGKIPDMKATATVYRKDKSHPFTVEVDYSEVVKMVTDKKTGKPRPMGPWATMPKWMLRKVAVARALKEAFPGITGPAIVSINNTTEPDPDKYKEPEVLTDEDVEEGVEALYGKEKPITVEQPKEKPASPAQKNAILTLARQTGDLGLLANTRKMVKNEGISYQEAEKLIHDLQQQKEKVQRQA